MKPFNLERALAGDPVVTRDGRKVAKLQVVDDCFNLDRPLFVLLSDKTSFSLYKEGNECAIISSPRDLFMAPLKKRGWINIYDNYKDRQTGICIFDSHKQALEMASNEKVLIATIKIEWGE